jgi:hypothetical protein
MMAEKRSEIMCAMCGKVIIGKERLEKQILVEIIDGKKYTFDKVDCMLMFKKFQAVHGSNLFGSP